MAVTTAKIRAREKKTGKKAYTGIDNAGNLHYAFDNTTLQSILQKSNVAIGNSQSAKAFENSLAQSNANNAFNAQQVQNQMDFQERMSSTSHQREVKDLIAAGLNPVLSANGGASTPSGSSATADTSTAALKAQMFMQQLNAGVQLAVNRQNIESAQKIAKWQNDLNREISYASLENQENIANISAAASMYGADQASSASRYGAELSSAASRYGSQLSSAASRYATDNPNDPYMFLLKGLLGDSSSAGTTAKRFVQHLTEKSTGYKIYQRIKDDRAARKEHRRKYEASKNK